MTVLNWYIRTGSTENLMAATSSIGFFGPQGFGYPIHTGYYNDTSYICDASTGTTQYAEALNNKYANTSGVYIWQSSTASAINTVPNSKSAIHLSFTGSAPVGVNNVWLTACSRYTSTSSPNLYVYGAEVCHTSTTYSVNNNSNVYWSSLNGATGMNLHQSPGYLGQSATVGTTSLSTQHDWYILCSVRPSSSGSQSFALYAQLEYI